MSENFFDIDAVPCSPPSSVAALSPTSCVISIEQNFGRHTEQKCATLCASLASVSFTRQMCVRLPHLLPNEIRQLLARHIRREPDEERR
jgi:hypothetical protein